jgi:hypothetical protein
MGISPLVSGALVCDAKLREKVAADTFAGSEPIDETS